MTSETAHQKKKKVFHPFYFMHLIAALLFYHDVNYTVHHLATAKLPGFSFLVVRGGRLQLISKLNENY